MHRLKRPIAILLLFIFGFLSVKNLVPSIAAQASQNCEEFGHIHWYKLAVGPLNNDLTTTASPDQRKDDVCHSSKSIFNSSPLPVASFEFTVPTYSIYFEIVSSLKNRFASPDLEPLRRPPRA